MIQLVNMLSARWLLAGDIALNYLPLLVSLLNGQKIQIDAALLGKTNQLPFAIKGQDSINTVSRWELDSPDLPENSIAVIPLQGIVFDYDTQNLHNYLRMAALNPSINAVLLHVNTPGGMVTKIDIVSEQIANFPKPIISYVEDLNASAGAWLTSGSKKIILSSRLNRVGSIGVMTSFSDLWPIIEGLGGSHRNIYASKSLRKNSIQRTLTDKALSKEEQEKPLIADLDFVNEIFHAAMIKNRGLSADSEVLSGEIYYAEKAIELGLADEINTIEYAFNLAHKMGLENKINNYYLNQPS